MKTFIQFSDSVVSTQFKLLVREERKNLCLQLQYLVELDRRKYFEEHSSLWAYLVNGCGLEKSSAQRRIRAAQLMKRFPKVLSELESGRLNLTLLELAQGCAFREGLGDQELSEILGEISGLRCESAERWIASHYPGSFEIPHDRIRPLSDTLYEIRFVTDQAGVDQLEDLKGLLAHAYPKLSIGELVRVLGDEYRTRHHPEEKAKRAEARQAKKKGEPSGPSHSAPIVVGPPSPHNKRTPSPALVHALVKEQGYQCSYQDPVTQKKCLSRYALEIDHVLEWSKGGETKLSNLRYLCRLCRMRHNAKTIIGGFHLNGLGRAPNTPELGQNP